MNIVLAGHFTFPVGGAPAARMNNLGSGFRECGATVHVLAMAPNLDGVAQPASGQTETGVTFEHTGYVNTRLRTDNVIGLRGKTRRAKLKWFIRLYGSVIPTATRLKAMIRAGQCDLFIGYGRNAALLMPLVWLCHRHKVPCLLDIVEIPEQFAGIGGKLNPMYWDWVVGMRWMPKQFDGLTVITHGLEALYRQRGCRDILVVPSLEQWAAPPVLAPSIAAESFRLTYVGALLPRDAPEVLFGVMRVLAERDVPVQLAVAGRYEDTPTGRYWAEQCRSDPLLAKTVQLCGPLSDAALQAQLQASDGLILTRREAATEVNSFPTRLIEYLKQARPVFISAVGDVSRYLRDGLDAVLLPASAPEEAAKRIAQVAGSADRGYALGQQGFVRGAEWFDRQRHAARILEFASGLTRR